MNGNTPPSGLHRRIPRRHLLALLASASFGSAILACSGDDDSDSEASATTEGAGSTAAASEGTSTSEQTSLTAERPTGWTEASHSNDADPDYDVVFPKDRVNTLTITVTPENWQAMLDDMTELAGERGTGQGMGRGGEGAQSQLPGQGQAPGNGPMGGGPGDFTAENPMWVPATIAFNGLEWQHVGFRFKGNSSLRSAWSGGTDKLPFKLDFDEFEGDFPEIDNQRFYGFKQLSLSNNWNDPTCMRESVTYDLLEEAGLVAAETGFYAVVLDYGEGPKDLGPYTVIEVVDDTVIGRYFNDDGGNIYEAEGTAASFAVGTNTRIQESFQVESDEDQADWSDIQALYDALHSSQRTADPDAWRESLEAVFEVDSFIEWLALSTLLQHWDTYGGMSHNYYLYNDPETGKLNWISWDHNLVLGAGGGNRDGAQAPEGAAGAAGGGPGGGGFSRETSFDKSEVSAQWPLISYLLDQPEYLDRYNTYLRELIDGVFEPSKVIARIEANEAILTPFAMQENADYAAAVDALATTVQQRVTEAEAYLEDA